MKRFRLFSFLLLASVALMGTGAGLTVTCNDGTAQSGNCAVGRVTFSSPTYGGIVHIRVVRDAMAQVYDDFDYDTAGGALNFTESLIPSGSYTVTLTSNGNTFTQSVTSGQ